MVWWIGNRDEFWNYHFIRAKMNLNTTHLAIFIIFSTFQDVLKNHLSKIENQSGIQPGIHELLDSSEFSSKKPPWR